MTPDFEVLIIGSGFGGLCVAIRLEPPDFARTSYWKVALTSVAPSREPVTFSTFRVLTYPTNCVSTPRQSRHPEQTTCVRQVKSEITHGLGNNRWVPQVSLLRPGIRATDSRWKPHSLSCH